MVSHRELLFNTCVHIHIHYDDILGMFAIFVKNIHRDWQETLYCHGGNKVYKGRIPAEDDAGGSISESRLTQSNLGITLMAK